MVTSIFSFPSNVVKALFPLQSFKIRVVRLKVVLQTTFRFHDPNEKTV